MLVDRLVYKGKMGSGRGGLIPPGRRGEKGEEGRGEEGGDSED